jgi:pSer/pThr/pTyr-binding forkhead associated (FHA) protein
MTKHYLLVSDQVVFELVHEVSIGRKPDNDICLSDLSVSGVHARVRLSEHQVIVEDLNSLNGTFVNGHPINKAVLANGDTIRVGKVILRLVQTKDSQIDLTETGEFIEDPGQLQGPARLTEAISIMVPLFDSLDSKTLAQISQAAEFLFANPGKTIIEQGDRDRSLYIILDGKVNVFTYDNQGRKVDLDFLSENQFFGEISLLTGVPRTVTVQALNKTFLCKVSFETLREVFHRSPVVKADLEQHARDRLKNWDAKRREAGFVERRRHTRYNLRLPVRFLPSPTSSPSGRLREDEYRSTSLDISVSGIRVAIQDDSFQGLPIGCKLRLEISLPQPWGSLRCLGDLRHVLKRGDGQGVYYLGVEFAEMLPDQREKLDQFLAY